MKFTLRNIGLLPYDSEKGGYVVRFRIVSQDKNRSSAWSNFILAELPESMIGTDVYSPAAPAAGDIASYHTSLGDGKYLVTVTWAGDSDYGLSAMDVYTRQDAIWTYRGRMPLSSASNLVQFVFSGTPTFDVRFSFHRPSKVSAVGEPPVASRLFVVDKTVS